MTEVMFHPENPADDSPYGDEEFEFVEIKNISNASVELVGYQFTSGIDFRFTTNSPVTRLAPGERVLVVKNRAAFATRYPGVENVAGEYQGILSNAGGRLTLVGPLFEPVADLTYDADHFPLADGPGFSLVPSDEALLAARPDQVAAWRISAEPGGSPGRADAPPTSVPPIYVNELLPEIRQTQTCRIELLNPNNAALDVSGWFLTDNFRTPKKHRLPNGTVIPPNGFFVLSGAGFAAPDGSTFTFNAAGEEVYLLSADAAGKLTGWLHGFEYGAVPRGGSFGRYRTSAGAEAFVIQSSASLGAVNAGPRIGPAVISEINGEPITGSLLSRAGDEFIELRNITAQPLPLFDAASPPNSWRVRGEVDFDFPAGLVLPAGAYLILVGFDPAAYPWATAALRGRFGIDDAAVVMGPWTSDPDTVRGTVRLLRPALSAVATLPRGDPVPYEIVDEVDYLGLLFSNMDATAATGSLTRRDVHAYGNDPGNWWFARPTPGDADADDDQLGDRWELANGLNAASATGENGPSGDPDGDGSTNLQELMAGTLPRDAASRLQLRASHGKAGLTTLSFRVPPGRTCTLQFRENLNSGTWQDLRTVLGLADGEEVVVSETFTGATRYYRLVAP
jgi:hypothetical protein